MKKNLFIMNVVRVFENVNVVILTEQLPNVPQWANTASLGASLGMNHRI